MANRSFSRSITRLFILLNIIIWFGLGILIAIDSHPAIPDQSLYKAFLTAGALSLAIILSGLFYFLGKQNRNAYYLTITALIITSLLAFFDDFGWIDLIVLVINLIPVGLLIKDRKWYLGKLTGAV